MIQLSNNSQIVFVEKTIQARFGMPFAGRGEDG